MTKATQIIKHTRQLPLSLPSKLRYHAFELVFNAVPTYMRERWRPNQPTLCPLCGNEDETIHHLHTCTTSHLSIDLILKRHPNKGLLSCLHSISEDDLTFYGTDCPPEQRLVKLIFSLSIWRTRRHFLFPPPFRPTTPKLAAKRIADYFSKTYYSILHKKKRKKRNKIAEKNSFLEKLSQIPRNALLTFTDGSSFGNPGPGGAGYYMFTRLAPLPHHLFSSTHLPNTTNNKAELQALTEALTFIEARLTNRASPHIPPIHLFSDSLYAINATLGNSRPKTHLSLVRDARRAFERLSRQTTPHISQVPGHAKIFYNEVADFLAKRGSAGITSRNPPPIEKIHKIRRKCKAFDSKHPPGAPSPLDPSLDSELELADELDSSGSDNDPDPLHTPPSSPPLLRPPAAPCISPEGGTPDFDRHPPPA